MKNNFIKIIAFTVIGILVSSLILLKLENESLNESLNTKVRQLEDSTPYFSITSRVIYNGKYVDHCLMKEISDYSKPVFNNCIIDDKTFIIVNDIEIGKWNHFTHQPIK